MLCLLPLLVSSLFRRQAVPLLLSKGLLLSFVPVHCLDRAAVRLGNSTSLCLGCVAVFWASSLTAGTTTANGWSDVRTRCCYLCGSV